MVCVVVRSSYQITVIRNQQVVCSSHITSSSSSQASYRLRRAFSLVEQNRAVSGRGARGTAARLAWDQVPRKPCAARLPSGAGTFAPLCGAKVTAFLKAVEKVQGLFRQPEMAGMKVPAMVLPLHGNLPAGRVFYRGYSKTAPEVSTLWPQRLSMSVPLPENTEPSK